MPPYYFDIRPVRLGSDRWQWDGNESGKKLFDTDDTPRINPSWEVITPASPKRLRVGLERVAWWFKREMRYDSPQYNASETTDSRDRLWIHISHRDGEKPVVGGAAFRYTQWKDHPAGLALSFVYLHPFVRRDGVLSDVWYCWRKAYGNFVVDTPLTPAMAAFLRKKGECWLHGVASACGGCAAPLSDS